MVLDDVFPKMFLKKMFGTKRNHKQGKQRQNPENEVLSM